MATKDIDWEQFSDEELEAISQGNLDTLSDQQLSVLAGESARGPSSPYKLLEASARMVSDATLSPMLEGMDKASALTPEGMLPAAGGSVGLALGNMFPVPFAGMAGAATGAAVGDVLRQRRGLMRQGGGSVSGSSVAMQGALGAGSALAFRGVERGAKALGRFISPKMGKEFGRQMAGKVAEFRRGSNRQFGSDLSALSDKYPLRMTDARQAFQDLETEIASNPNLKELLKQGARNEGDDVLLKFLEEGYSDSKRLTLDQAQQMRATINKIHGIARELPAGQGGQYLPSERPLLKFKDTLSKETDKAFPGYAKMSEEHGKRMTGIPDLEARLQSRRLRQGGVPSLSGNPDLRIAYKSSVPRSMRLEAGDVESLNLGKKVVTHPFGILGAAAAYGLKKFIADPIIRSNQSTNH